MAIVKMLGQNTEALKDVPKTTLIHETKHKEKMKKKINN
jgi:hypothetical protein